MENKQKIVSDAYIFGYPLILSEISRRAMTNTHPGTFAPPAPMNHFNHVRVFPDDTFTDIVTPNADTLYSVAWLDLSEGPLVLSIPDTKGRYYLMQMLDAWSNVFASPGKRTTGTEKQDFVITGTGWKGEIPSGAKQIQSPTSLAWILGRTQTNGKKDYDAVHAIQDEYKLAPLSGTPQTKKVETTEEKRSPVDQIAAMSAGDYFNLLTELLVKNPPNAADASIVEKMKSIGIQAGQSCELSDDLEEGAKQGLAAIVGTERNSSVSLKMAGVFFHRSEFMEQIIFGGQPLRSLGLVLISTQTPVIPGSPSMETINRSPARTIMCCILMRGNFRL